MDLTQVNTSSHLGQSYYVGRNILHLILMFIFSYRQISKRRMFVNLGFLKSKFSCLTIGKYRQDGRLKISDFKHPTVRI